MQNNEDDGKAPPLRVVLSTETEEGTSEQAESSGLSGSNTSSSSSLVSSSSSSISLSRYAVGEADGCTSNTFLLLQLLEPNSEATNEPIQLNHIINALDNILFILKKYIDDKSVLKDKIDLLERLRRQADNKIFIQHDVVLFIDKFCEINQLYLDAMKIRAEEVINKLESKGYEDTDIIKDLNYLLTITTKENIYLLENKINMALCFLRSKNTGQEYKIKENIDEIKKDFYEFIIDKIYTYITDDLANTNEYIRYSDESSRSHTIYHFVFMLYKISVIYKLISILLIKSEIYPEWIDIIHSMTEKMIEYFDKSLLLCFIQDIQRFIKINDICGEKADKVEDQFDRAVLLLLRLDPCKLEYFKDITEHPVMSDTHFKSLYIKLMEMYQTLIECEDHRYLLPQSSTQTILADVIHYVRQQANNKSLSPNPYETTLSFSSESFTHCVEARLAGIEPDTKLMAAVLAAYVPEIARLLPQPSPSASDARLLLRSHSTPYPYLYRRGLRPMDPHRHSMPVRSTSSPASSSSQAIVDHHSQLGTRGTYGQSFFDTVSKALPTLESISAVAAQLTNGWGMLGGGVTPPTYGGYKPR